MAENADSRLYEGLFLFDAGTASRRWAELEGRVQEIFKKHEATVRYSERWPDQRLAYEIEGTRKGTYFLTYFDINPQHLTELRRDAQLSQDILRALFVQEEDLEEEIDHRKKLAERRGRESSSPTSSSAPSSEGGEAPAAPAPAAPAE